MNDLIRTLDKKIFINSIMMEIHASDHLLAFLSNIIFVLISIILQCHLILLITTLWFFFTLYHHSPKLII